MSKTRESATPPRKFASAKTHVPIVQTPVAQLANTSELKNYSVLFKGVSALLETSRRASARSVNATMTATYWEVGRRLVEFELKGEKRADYGDTLLEQLSSDLTARFGRGYAKSNLYQMRTFYLTYKNIFQTLSGKLGEPTTINAPTSIFQTVSEESLALVATRFPLPWSAYVRLLGVRSEIARSFYEAEALRGGWSVRQLDRQIDSQFYERTALSKNKAAMLTKGAVAKPEDAVTPEQEIKDPFVLEFLNLKDEYSETNLDQRLTLLFWRTGIPRTTELLQYFATAGILPMVPEQRSKATIRRFRMVRPARSCGWRSQLSSIA